ncbi:hypothetical protein CRE_25831 [Caenorhabditis remanei]|uniref:Tyrosine-protein phosphatase domain-containing protein n=1 Tax=Caenorhabditis remanei TaxID=31234 RepID=E3NAB3_CAERE|nr:hypothetical protein CRE_25831 [Caenorhabditis remanei]
MRLKNIYACGVRIWRASDGYENLEAYEGYRKRNSLSRPRLVMTMATRAAFGPESNENESSHLPREQKESKGWHDSGCIVAMKKCHVAPEKIIQLGEVRALLPSIMKTLSNFSVPFLGLMSMVTFVTIATCSNQIVYPLEALEKINSKKNYKFQELNKKSYFQKVLPSSLKLVLIVDSSGTLEVYLLTSYVDQILRFKLTVDNFSIVPPTFDICASSLAFPVTIFNCAYLKSGVSYQKVVNYKFGARNFVYLGIANSKYNFPDDPLTKSLEQLQMVSRITNAIYLQHGLITGSIPTNELISELFHLGSILPSDIHSIDATKVQGAITALKELPSKLQPPTDILTIENSFAELKTILEVIDGMGDIREWKEEKTKFKTGIQKLADSGVVTTEVSSLTTATNSWSIDSGRLLQSKTDASALSSFQYIEEALKVIQNGSDSLENWEIPSSTTPGLTPIVLANDGVVKYFKHSLEAIVSETDVELYVSYFDTIRNETKAVKDASQQTTLIHDLLKLRLSKHLILNYTSGFPGGSADVPVVHNDLKNTWIKKIVNTESLAVALSELKTLEPSISKIEAILKSKEVVDSTMPLLAFISEIGRIESKTDEFKKAVPGMYGCNPPESKAKPKFTKVQVLLDHLKKVDEMSAELKNKTELLKEYLKNPEIGEWCAEVIKICKEAETNPNIQEIVNKFKNYGHRESLTKHIMEIQKLAQAVINVQETTTIQNVSKDAVAKFDDLDEYHASVGHYAEYFDCLQKKNLDRVFEMVESLKGIRSRHGNQKFADSMDGGMKTVNALNGLAGSFKELENVIVAQKGFRSKEMEALGILKNGQKHSMTIGRAVEGVWNMKKALDRRSEVKLDIGVIQKYRSVLTNDSGDLKNLDVLVEMPKEILEMYIHLDKFQKTVQFSNDTILANHSSIFENAKMVTGLTDSDTSSLMSTLERLIQHMKDSEDVKKLEKVETDLKLLESLGLNFASGYKKSFEESKNTLKALDSFFLSYAKQMSATPAPPKLVTKPTPTNQKGKMPEVVTVTVEKKVESDESMACAAGTPDDSSAASTPDDSSAAGTPDDSSAAGTPDDSSAAGTPDDSSAAGTPDDSSAAGTPDDSSAAGTPDDSSAAGTPDDSSAAGTPDDSSAAGTPDDSSAAGTPDDSSAAGTPDDSSAAGTPDSYAYLKSAIKTYFWLLIGIATVITAVGCFFLAKKFWKCMTTIEPVGWYLDFSFKTLKSFLRTLNQAFVAYKSRNRADYSNLETFYGYFEEICAIDRAACYPFRDTELVDMRRQCRNRKKPRRNDVFDVTHYFYKGWRDDDDVPSNVDTILHIIHMLEKKEKKVIVKNTLMVVCGNGVARSGPFTFIMHAIQSMRKNEEPNLQNTMTAIHQARPYPISNGRLYGFCVYAIAKYVNDYCKGEDSFDWEEEAIYNDLVAGYNGWREGRDAVANRGQH